MNYNKMNAEALDQLAKLGFEYSDLKELQSDITDDRLNGEDGTVDFDLTTVEDTGDIKFIRSFTYTPWPTPEEFTFEEPSEG